MRPRRVHTIRQFVTFAVLSVLAAGFLLWMLMLDGGVPSVSSGHYQVQAVLPDGGAQLVPGARVTTAGVQVGHVGAISRRGADALVELTIDDHAVTPLPADSRVELRTRTPLGENYLEVLVGHSRSMLPSGAAIPVRQTAQTVEVDQVLSVLSGRDRTRARRLIQALGGAVAGRGAELNELTGAAASALTSGSQVVDVLAGQRTQISRLVDQLGELTSGIGQEGSDIRELADGGLATFRAIASRDGRLRQLLDVLPPTLRAVRTTTHRLQRVSGEAAPVLFDLASTVDAARPSAELLGPASRELRRVLGDLGTAAAPLELTLGGLQRLSPKAAVILPQARRLLCQLDPAIGYAKPYTADILALFDEFGSAANAFDSIGHTMLMDPSINEDAYVGQNATTAAALRTLLEAGLLSGTSRLTYDPFPRPGQANAVAGPGATQVTGPSTLRAQTGYRYPHVLPEC